MDAWKSILKILSSTMETPGLYGAYHIIWLAVVIGLTVLACLRGKYATEKKVRWVVFLTAVAVAICEVYKQVVFTFGDGSGEPGFQWYAFPWQFCSTPMYIGLLTGVFRKGKVHDALCAYLATYAVFAGTVVMIYPGDVYIDLIGINIQTMICHGSMPVIGAYLLSSGHVKLQPRTILKAVPVFACCVGVALVLNELAYSHGIGDFNMFFVSRHVECTLPVYSLVHNAVPFPLNLIIYILGFTAAAFIMLLIAMGIRHLAGNARHKAVAAASLT
ncbi:MAG: YwaF family protein [Oscillospiraceae bacterium]|nr:YwaF family protein [Oscillospiraceae bacterium]